MDEEDISVRVSTLAGRTRGETEIEEKEPERKEESDSWDDAEWAVKISRYGDGPDLDGLGEYSPFAEWDEEEEDEEEEEGEYECPDCGASLHEEDNVCTSCGAEFEEEGEEEEIGEEAYGEVGIVEFTGGRYAGEEEVDFIIDMSYFEFDEEDFGYECPECGVSLGAEDSGCQECGIDFDSEEDTEVWGE